MGKKNKLERFADLMTFPNVVESFDMNSDLLVTAMGSERSFKGRWAEDFFENKGPVVLELACGKGEYSLGLGRLYPEKNFLGIDIKGNRIWKGAKTALDEGLKNVGFLRTRIERIERYFDDEEVDEIWITFPDPFSRLSKESKRLTSSFFLGKYIKILKEGAHVQLKTDALDLFDFTIASFGQHPHYSITEIIDDVYQLEELGPELGIQTFYEKIHLKQGRTIGYVKARYSGSKV